MVKPFQPDGLPVFIGSLPLAEHQEAFKLVSEYTPEIPLWVQLPVHKEEGMVAQFMPGLPGLCAVEGRQYIDTAGDDFNSELIQFYEDYLAVVEGNADLSDSRFALDEDTAERIF